MIASVEVEVEVVRCTVPHRRTGVLCNSRLFVVQRGAAWAMECPRCGGMNSSHGSSYGLMPTPLETLAQKHAARCEVSRAER